MSLGTSVLNRAIRRAYSQGKIIVNKESGATTTAGGSSSTERTSAAIPNVSGLSSNCVRSVSGPVGPGAAANAEYKVPEYFCFNRFSYHEAEVEMAKYRCPQPSALSK